MLTDVCREVGVSRTIVYRWIRAFAKNKEQNISNTVSLATKRAKQWNRLSTQVENKIIRLTLKQPLLSAKEISKYVNVSAHGVWNVLKRNRLNTQQLRNIYLYKNGTSLIKQIQLNDKVTAMRRYEAGEKVSNICKDFNISRTIFYRWLKRYSEKQNLDEQAKREALQSLRPKGERHYRFVPEASSLVLKIVLEHPEYSSEKISSTLLAKTGKKILGNHGIYNLLNRLNLNTYQNRLAYVNSASNAAEAQQGVSHVAKGWGIPVFGEIPSLSGLSLPGFFDKTSSYFKYLIPALIIISLGFIFSVVLSNLSFGQVIVGKIGILPSFGALFLGMFFFIYSIKYYLTIAIVLSFSRRSPSKSSGLKAGGLEADLSSIVLQRHPFVSIHIASYNEKIVIERLLKSLTSMQYDNYEVVIADDSNDDTTLNIADYINNNANEARIKKAEGDDWTLNSAGLGSGIVLKHLHRSSRSGFKGGALKVALEHTDPRAEYILIFDADFIPYPDTIVQFLKYFQSTAGTLDFVNKSQNKAEPYAEQSGSQRSSASQVQLSSASRVAAIQGYQWHVLNKSENWITRGVRSEYAGSYVIERSGEEIYSGLKQISGSVYMIRKDILSQIGWGTSITEDFELTLKLYEKGFKVVYTPYIQAPAEGVSTIKRLIRKRMRWAEGHSHDIRKMFVRLMFGKWESSSTVIPNSFRDLDSSRTEMLKQVQHDKEKKRVWKQSPLTLPEKLEFLYLSPYYLQAAFFILGTLSWFIAEVVFKVRLPFWTEVWGWSLVFTNLLALPLLNMVGLFLEESDEKDYLGLFSFIVLSYIVAPFQAYAAIKGFIAKEEGPWFRTPKTGRITDTFMPGRLYRYLRGMFGRPSPALQGISNFQLPIS